MIQIKNNRDCVGCEACINICDRGAINMFPDREGFLYPSVDVELCVDCGLCNKVCPVINQGEERTPLFAFGAINRDESVCFESSSGGVFTLLAQRTLEHKGVVFGACFDKDWNVIHASSDTIEGIAKFRGSKYVQSRIGDTFHEVKDYLHQGREVLFSGTPCQIAGLNLYLRKKYDNLVTIDFICHGVPSPMVWGKYKQELLLKNNANMFKHISFRNKEDGWRRYNFKAVMQTDQSCIDFRESVTQNMYLKGFIRDLYLRPSCYFCPSKKLKSESDITISDFWDVNQVLPEINEDKGVSLVMINTNKGEKFIEGLNNMLQISVDFHASVKQNKSVCQSVDIPYNRKKFWRLFHKGSVESAINLSIKMSFLERIIRKIKKTIS